ncbi:MAG: hypothetical protein ACRDZ8_16080 [Acidimicrobiales bacterium]
MAVVLFAAIIGGAVILTHHGSTGSATGKTSTTTTGKQTSDSTAPTTAAGSPSTIPAESPTPPSLAAAYTPDPIVVLHTLTTYIDWVFAHPNPALVANYMLPSSRTYSSAMMQLGTLKASEWHQRPGVTDIAFAKADGPFPLAPATLNGHQAYQGTGVRVIVNSTPESLQVLNSSGQVVSSFNNPAQQFLVISLAQGSDGQFRISDEAEFHPSSISAFES